MLLAFLCHKLIVKVLVDFVENLTFCLTCCQNIPLNFSFNGEDEDFLYLYIA